MSLLGCEVADVFRLVGSKISSLHFSAEKLRVFRAITGCRTAALGGHVRRCDKCLHIEQAYNSCWNRHCPKCQGGATFEWVRRRTEEILPVPYFHVVFTLPSEFRELCYRNKRLFYNLFFQASAQTLKAVALSRHGIELGFFGVLHTWNQRLQYHPHIHYACPAGGLKNEKWQDLPYQGRFFLPVRILSKLFRGKFISLLKKAYNKERLYLQGSLEYLSDPRAFEHLISKAASSDWVVYAKKPFSGAKVVVKYLASYTHRVAISNSRLRSVTSEKVSFLARDRGRKRKKKLVSLSPHEFTRRFLFHVLPRGFQRIRYFGYLFNEKRKSNLAAIRELLASSPQAKDEQPLNRCPVCKKGTLVLLHLVKPHRPIKKPWFPAVASLDPPEPLCLAPPSTVLSC